MITVSIGHLFVAEKLLYVNIDAYIYVYKKSSVLLNVTTVHLTEANNDVR